MAAHPAEPEAARPIAETLSARWPRLEAFARAAAVVMAATILIYAASVVIRVNWPGYGGEAIHTDFTAFWAAAKLALAGEASAAFDPARLEAAMSLPPADTPRGSLLWLYPPAWHLVITPLGLLPFSAAFLLYSVVAYLAYALAVRPLAAPLPGGLPLMLAGPSVVLILQHGNNSLLWTAGLVAALSALANGRAALAGCLIALLTLKPQLGLLIPVALLAGGHWRAVSWAIAGTLAIAALSTALLGVGYWVRWFEMLGAMSSLMETDLVRFNLMITGYAFARFWGASHEIAYGVQAALALGAAVAVGWVWRRPVSNDLKAVTLCVATPLATPYAWHYEMSLALVAAMFLARDGFGRTLGARIWLVALWLGQVPGLALMSYLPPAAYVPPLLTATLSLCLWRATGAREPNAARTGRGEGATAPGTVAEGTARG